ncbi:hypothetical protein [Rhizobium mongolense]|uniref:Chromosome segregation ATPase n=1 Tax=Rhizobium mongolense TaxID=57676 RepID=A0A7W6RSG0_9HYPH|nr:hypothetical protein [Rhizobium mongolense]MBB4277246.1 chromosome segregation ATPase [Rhizobium mongolense]
MTATISERISAVEATLAALRAKRGAAVLDDSVFDALEYANLEGELEALRDAEGEQVRRERHAAGSARTAHKAEQRDRLKDLERQRTEALKRAEEATRALAASLERTLSLNDQMAAAAHEIAGSVPSPLNGLDFARRLSNRLAAVMATIAGHRHRLGNLEWHNSMSKPSDDWAAGESRLLEPHLKSILEK